MISSLHQDDDKIMVPDPYTSVFRDILIAAKNKKASDVHIQPTRDGVDIRLRTNGELVLLKSLYREHRQGFINEVKRLTNLSIAVSGKAQDARVSFKNWNLDIRTSLLPSQYGEKIVLRLLDMGRRFDISDLKFDETTLNDVTEALRAKNGVIIISGPTGSGKTTTLYTLLSYLDRVTNNIITLEDPIEYGIDGLTQVQVNSKLKFADALRAVLRQDPDVILVGEVRDPETASLCVQAALTGHLVLSTIHANGAPEVIARLINLGVDPHLIESSLKFSAAQRLVKKICPKCSVKADIELISKLEKEATGEGRPNFKRRNPEGCSNCTSGVVGRNPILEYMGPYEIHKYLSNGTGQCPFSLRDAALTLAWKGEVDVKDAMEID